MLGTERFDRELLDTLSVCGDLVPVGSVYRFLAVHRRRVFPDGLFGDLFGGRGRPSVPVRFPPNRGELVRLFRGFFRS